MKFSVSSSELLRSILAVQKAIPAKAAEAILEDYLFVLRDNVLQITASDMEITLRTELTVDSMEEEGRIAVPARQITELLKELPDQPLTLSTLGESSFECAWTSGSSTLPYFNADDYPQIATTGENATTVEFPAGTLAEGIGSTVYAASDEDRRPIMNSIFFDIRPDATTLVASDLQKLICYTADNVKVPEAASFVLNKRHAGVLRALLGKEEGAVTISFDEKTAVFRFGATTLISTLVVGKYPDYRTIIPVNNANILQVSRAQLLNTVRRIAVCSPKASNQIKFELTAGSLEISAQDVGFEIAAHDRIACQYDGEDLVIGLKSTYIIEILSNFTCETIVMKFADKRRSVLILPAEEESSREKVFGIVMPVLVR
ncbi:MAG: DNA polymerase III subunit beta [Bacteroidales bacterium]|nr:DNA polymerase III subunit beta [Bacteroidales bacterium]